jgi:hypothetical protein
VVGKRLLHYVAAGLLSTEDLTLHLESIENKTGIHKYLIQTFHDPFELVQDLQVRKHFYSEIQFSFKNMKLVLTYSILKFRCFFKSSCCF